MFFWNGSQAVSEELIIVYRLDIGQHFYLLTHAPGTKAHPLVIKAQCELCSLETTTLTGLFITAKLGVAVLKAGPLSPQCFFVMYVVVHTKEGPL